MASNPIQAVSLCVLWAFWVSLLSSANYDAQDLPPCSGWDVLTGCDDTTSQLFAIFVVGTIPGAPHQVNAFFAAIGVLARISGIWSLMELIRGN